MSWTVALECLSSHDGGSVDTRPPLEVGIGQIGDLSCPTLDAISQRSTNWITLEHLIRGLPQRLGSRAN